MYGLFLPLSFLIPSSSGLATVAMPIMAPLASFANVPPELVVTAYQTGNGLVNLVTPTSAVVMGGLAIARWAMAPGSSSCGRCSIMLAILTVVVLTGGLLLRVAPPGRARGSPRCCRPSVRGAAINRGHVSRSGPAGREP